MPRPGLTAALASCSRPAGIARRSPIAPSVRIRSAVAAAGADTGAVPGAARGSAG